MTNKYPGVPAPADDVDNEEPLARCSFNKYDVRGGKVTINAFIPPKKKQCLPERIREISVDRFDYLDMKRAVQLATTRAEKRPSRFRGWAIILAGMARGKGREVLSSPSEEEGNPAHADIVLPESTTTDEEVRKEHLTALAELASWRAVASPISDS